jgi:hypothetical protein
MAMNEIRRIRLLTPQLMSKGHLQSKFTSLLQQAVHLTRETRPKVQVHLWRFSKLAIKEEVTKSFISLNNILSTLTRQIKSASTQNGQLQHEKTCTALKIDKLKTTVIGLRDQRKHLEELVQMTLRLDGMKTDEETLVLGNEGLRRNREGLEGDYYY